MRGKELNQDNIIYVTEPSLPPLKEFLPYLEQIWESKWLTNNGPFHQKFEKALCDYLGVKHISVFANGTLALITALQALNISGEVITTPFSFVATTHALNWNGIKPVFCDIEPKTMNLDSEKIESHITPQTTAILPVHVYGNPCNMEKIEKIADIYGLKVIYDAAHAFGVKKNGKTILNHGDLSILSFHATKVFNTFEGGAIISKNEKMKKRIDFLKNFGFAGEVTVVGPGINAKMNEFQAALGLLQLNSFDKQVKKRKKIANYYRDNLNNIKGLKIFNDIKGVLHNYSYFPILIDSVEFGKSRNNVYEELKKNQIFARRYFYPLISSFPTYRDLKSANPDKLPIAQKISEQVLCLPIYPHLEDDVVVLICNLIKKI